MSLYNRPVILERYAHNLKLKTVVTKLLITTTTGSIINIEPVMLYILSEAIRSDYAYKTSVLDGS